jgi:thymidylate synthase
MFSTNPIFAPTANIAWVTLLEHVLSSGGTTSPRGLKSQELINMTTCCAMHKPIVTIKDRKLGYRFLFAEAYWILSGDNRVQTIAPYSKHIQKFSDDGHTFFGAYGPKIVEQIPYVISSLMRDKDTRQAVLTIWRENPPQSKDIPCTISVQWLIRNNNLHCIDNMRSSDIWLGWPYDVFNFSMISSYVLLMLKDHYPTLELGNISMNLGSAHLYEKNFNDAQLCITNLNDYKFRYGILEPKKEFIYPSDLLYHLKCVAENRHSELKSQWCCCIARGDHNK